jgi:hypothetical protein
MNTLRLAEEKYDGQGKDKMTSSLEKRTKKKSAFILFLVLLLLIIIIITNIKFPSTVE